MNLKDMLIRLVFFVVPTGVTACSIAPAIPEDHYYRLPSPHRVEALAHPVIHGTVGVAPLHARGLYQERAILYVNGDSPLELHLYHYRFWTESPAHLIQDHVVEYLRKAGIADKVVRYEPGVSTDRLVSGSIDRFERLVGAHDRVIVSLELRYGDADRLQPPEWTKTYTVTEPVQNRTVPAVATAFGAALDRVCQAFVRDLARVPRKGHP